MVIGPTSTTIVRVLPVGTVMIGSVPVAATAAIEIAAEWTGARLVVRLFFATGISFQQLR
jgi:hypothetical protein